MSLSILIFDSGVGGLTIYDSVRAILPQAHYTYLFDNQFFPYGELADKKLIARVSTVIHKAVALSPPDIIVIACNSASTLALPTLRQQFNMPIVGVVPAIKPAALVTANNVIGLLATPGTVMRPYTKELISNFALGKTVLQIGDSLLVKMAEDKVAGRKINIDELRKIISHWLLLETRPDTIVLGCTHFPLIKEELALALGYPVHFVDSGEAIGRRVKLISSEMKIGNKQQGQKNRAMCTRLDDIDKNLEISFEKYDFSKIESLLL